MTHAASTTTLGSGPTGPVPSASPADPLETRLRGGVQRIRAALAELYASAGADPSAPQEVSRSVGVNRNLAWKLSRILAAEEPLETVEHLPGAAGLSIMLEAFRRAGASDAAATEVRGAIDAFDALVRDEVGDRDTLDILVGGMLPPELQAERDRAARRLAFRGNSATWGIQAQVQLSATFWAPHPGEPTMLDAVSIGGLFGFRRLRRGIHWPLLRVNGFRQEAGEMRPIERRFEPLDPDVPSGDPPLMPRFCSGEQPPIEERRIPGGRQFEIVDGPLGNRGAVNTVTGFVDRRAASCVRDPENDAGELIVGWFTPVRESVVDVLVHRDLPLGLPPAVRLAGRLGPAGVDPILTRHLEPIPFAEPIRSLGGGPPRLSTPLVPRYGEMVELVFDRMSWDPAAFVAYRLQVPFPPIPTMCILEFPLGDPPGE